jgi:hypothetical protein
MFYRPVICPVHPPKSQNMFYSSTPYVYLDSLFHTITFVLFGQKAFRRLGYKQTVYRYREDVLGLRAPDYS